MTIRRGPSVSAAITVTTAMALVVVALRWLTPPGLCWQPDRLARAVTQRDAAAGLAVVLAALAWLVAGWLAVGVAAALAGRLPGAVGRLSTAIADVVTPGVIRRFVELAVGATMVAGPLAGGVAVAATPPNAPGPAATTASLPRPPSLDRPATPPHQPHVVVRPGDTLWAIAARRLRAAGDPGITDAEITAAWPRWYAANRAVIGPDPDLIRPGERLAPPPTRHHEEP